MQDITLGDGRGGDSIYGADGFEDEAFGLQLRHDAPGLLTMAPSSSSYQSRFRITFGPQPQMDGRVVVIGRLVSGSMHLPVLEAIPVDSEGRPARPLTIVDCGAIPGFSGLPIVMTGPPAATTLDSVDAKADQVRSSVAEAVAAAAAFASQGTDRHSSGQHGKRPAGSGMIQQTSVKRGTGSGGMMALTFIGDNDSEGDSDEEDEGGA